MATFIISLIVVVLVCLAVKSIIKNAKSGGCGCGCENCQSHCHDTHK